MKRAIYALGLSLLVAVPAAAQTSVAGDWEVTIVSPQGTSTAQATLKQDGDKVSGVLRNPMGELPFENGTLTGDELKFLFTINFQGTPLSITLIGKVNGSTIDGKADFGGMAEGEWTAKRITATTASAAASPSGAASTAGGGATAASSGGIAGTWDVTFMTPQGEFPATATLTNEGGKVSGTFASQLGQVPVSGTLDGTTVKLSLVAESPQGSMSVAMTGELAGDSIVKGSADVSGMGQMEWSAKRAKP